MESAPRFTGELDFFRDSDGGRVLSKEDDPMFHEHSYAKVPPVPLLCDPPDSTNDGPCSASAQPKGVVFELGTLGLDNLTANTLAIDAVPQVSSKGPCIGDVSNMDDPTIRYIAGWDVFADYATEVEEGCLDQEELDGYAGFCAGMVKPIPAPLLQRPVSPPQTNRKQRKRAGTAPTRSSARQAARPSSIPVAERAQHKLMRELSFINGMSAALAPDAAVTAYIEMYEHNLLEEAVKSLRAATRLEDKELSRALAAIAAESGGVEMEVP